MNRLRQKGEITLFALSVIGIFVMGAMGASQIIQSEQQSQQIETQINTTNQEG